MAAIGAIVGGLATASAARKSANAQRAAAAEDIAFQRETRDIIRSDLEPYRSQGTNALAAYLYNMGLGPRPTFGGTAPTITEIPGATVQGGRPDPNSWRSLHPNPEIARRLAGRMTARTTTTSPTRYSVNGQVFDTLEQAQAYANANRTGGQEYQGFEASPGYQFRFDQGTQAVNALASARGGLHSGRTLQDLTRFGQGIASEEFGNYMSRLGGLVDTGMSAAQVSGQASQNAAAGVSNALAARGNAQAAGAIGVGNAVSGTINNLIGINQYQRNLAQPYNPQTGTGNWWLGLR
jgi:hypothetical protein